MLKSITPPSVYSQAARRKAPVNTHVIRAELIDSDTCTALGITTQSSTPVLAMCRALVDAGHNPSWRLDAYRGGVLCLRVRSIGEAARLRVNGEGTGFQSLPESTTGSPTRSGGILAPKAGASS